MNTNKNSYVIIYAAVMVILAAVLLAGANILLKPAQEENASIDKMEQILRRSEERRVGKEGRSRGSPDH